MKDKIIIITIVGARPQFIKAAVLSREFSKRNNIHEILIHTGQHYDDNMNRIFFDEMQIPKPTHNLEITSPKHGQMTGRMIEQIEKQLIRYQPDAVVVYGDTNSTLAGAIAAGKLNIPVVHIEAGLRSFNMQMPEEQNRIMTDHISTFLFCPNQNAINNLDNENIFDDKKFDDGRILKVKNCGDLMYEAIHYYKNIALKKSNILEKLDISTPYFLSTIHRPENTDSKEKLAGIFDFFKKTSKNIVLPLHPRTKKYIMSYNIDMPSNVRFIEPAGYLDMIMLLENSEMVLTDSGGLQKEAFWLKKPCVTLREQTEWTETIDSGWNILLKDYKGSHKITADVTDQRKNVAEKITDTLVREL